MHLLGYRDDVPDVVRAFDVAVLCSNREGMPVSIIEYMEAGRPVVATRVGAVAGPHRRGRPRADGPASATRLPSPGPSAGC